MASADTPSFSHCFHCGEVIPAGVHIMARLSPPQPVCCHGCAAVAELIANAGLADYYRHRQQPGHRPAENLDRWNSYADAAIAGEYLETINETTSVQMLIGGLRCAACVWLIEHQLRQLPGVHEVRVNAVTQRARVRGSGDLSLATLLRRVAQLGYEPTPLRPDQAHASTHELQQQEQRQLLKRLGVAALGMMQVMMYVLPLYTRDQTGMDADVVTVLSVLSLLITTPVLLYAGWPFLRSALRALQARQINMDVPVALALLLAYVASLHSLWVGHGETYFDSITMFIFLLTLGRYLEQRVRHATIDSTDALIRMQPGVAHRRVRACDVAADNAAAANAARGNSDWQDVPVSQLQLDDQLLVRTGEIMPADGCVLHGASSVNESLLTGEALPVFKQPGATVHAGTINVSAPLEIRVTALREQTLLSSLVRMMQQAQYDKPPLVHSADRIAQRFLALMLLFTLLVALGWWWWAPERLLPAVLAVLVVTCPCALSLATPTAIAAAISALSRQGVLVTRADAIERLASAQAVWFDKTGTLTTGHLSISAVHLWQDLSSQQALRLAVALETGTTHPVADALRREWQRHGNELQLQVDQLSVVPGAGVQGVIAGRWYRLGRADYVAELRAAQDSDTGIVLGDEHDKLAVFYCNDEVRRDAPACVRQLRAHTLSLALYSGDAESAVHEVARQLGIAQAQSRQMPQDKLAALQASDQRIVMVGDGINDAPVLSAAHVSVAMAQGAALAQANADLLLLHDRLSGLPKAVTIARAALRIMRQNLWWAAAYNLLAIPVAAMGWVTPWLAAAGMSLSSLLVTLNAARLMRIIPAEALDDSHESSSRLSTKPSMSATPSIASVSSLRVGT